MRLRSSIVPVVLIGMTTLAAFSRAAAAQAEVPGRTWTYRLLEGSFLLDDCLICGRPSIQQPLRGGFTLVLATNTPVSSSYELQDIRFMAGNSSLGTTTLAGQGTWRISGEVAVSQEMTLEGNLTDPATNTQAKVFTNDVKTVGRAWPILDVHLVQTDVNLVHFYSLRLLAAPVREIWFSTAASLTSSKWQAPTNLVGAGDILSDAGRVVRANGELLGGAGIMPPLPPGGQLDIDAFDIAAGGEILFSLKADAWSETLGQVHHGDLLTERGAVFRKNQELMAAFAPADTNADYGLDAVQVMTNGEIYFSITTNVVAPQIGMLFRGDVLSDRGRLVRSHQQLLSRFQPAVVDHDYGLDALYVWSTGEIWFSTEEGFNDNQLGPILAGDILSDQGFVVFHNLEVVSAFAPVEDLLDFGLDALYIVTDEIPPVPAPRMLSLRQVPGQPDIELRWDGAGRAFQVEKTSWLPGAFQPAGPIQPALGWTDPGPGTNRTGFYRIRQW